MKRRHSTPLNNELSSDRIEAANSNNVQSGVVKAGVGAAGVALVLAPPPVQVAAITAAAGGWLTNRWTDYQLAYQEGEIRKIQLETEQIDTEGNLRIREAQIKTERIEIQGNLQIRQIQAEAERLEKQRSLLEKEIELSNAKTKQIPEQKELLKIETDHKKAQAILIEKEIELVKTQTKEKMELNNAQMKAQAMLIEKQTELVNAQTKAQTELSNAELKAQAIKYVTAASVAGITLLWAYIRLSSGDGACNEEISRNFFGCR